MTGAVLLDPIVRVEEATNRARVGSKAAALSQLASLGFDVPPFFVIDARAFAQGGLSTAAQEAVRNAAQELGAGPYAVRSSSVEEDGAEHSHAGQFLSLLGVESGEVVTAAERVAQSGAEASVAAYRRNRGLKDDGAGPAVVVQQLVTARCAGVLFTADPLSGRRDLIAVSAVAGLGDKLVGGEVDGESYTLDCDGNTLARPQGAATLSDADLTKLVDLALAVEHAAGQPQDIEWAFDDERLYLLQARPITTPLRPVQHDDGQVTIFDNSNIVESYPGLVSPLTFSFAQYVYARVYRTFMALVGVDTATIRDQAVVFDNLLARIDGRVYYNLISWYRLLALLPGYQLNRGFMETMMGVGEPLPKDIADRLAQPQATGLAKLRDVARVAGIVVRLCYANLRIRPTISAFDKRLATVLGRDRTALKSLPLSELAGEYRRIEAKLLDSWDAPLINDFLCMIAFGASRKVMQRWAGTEGIELHNAMMIGQGDIVSAEPPRRISLMAGLVADAPDLIDALKRGDLDAASQMPELVAGIDDYLSKFSDRCTEELKLESVTLDEDPTPLLQSIAGATRSVQGQVPVSRVDPEKRLQELFVRRPLRRFMARVLLRWAKARVRDRENLRFERTRVFGYARQVFLSIGNQLYALGAINEPRDVFYLTVQEVLGAIEGNAVSYDLAGLAALRKKEARADASRPEPGERITVGGAVCARDRNERPPASNTENALERVGTGCSAGRVRARAVVVTDPRRQRLSAGEILVARHTDPGWIALFANAGGIVVERGSLLSHSAIVAREMGIPCVVGVKGATSWLKTGDVIEIDGATGVVRISNAP